MVNVLGIIDQMKESIGGSSIQYLFLIGILLFILIIVVAIILCARSLSKISDEKVTKEQTDKENKVRIEKIEALFIEDEIDTPTPAPVINEAPKLNLEEITKDMQRKIEQDAIELTVFEEEQEQESIISYNELLSDINIEVEEKLEPVMEIEMIPEEIKEDIITPIEIAEEKEEKNSFQDLLACTEERVSSFAKAKELVNEIVDKIEDKTPAKFRPSQIISPVFGVGPRCELREGENEASTILDTTDMTKIAEEIKETDEFLKELKAFRNSLD